MSEERTAWGWGLASVDAAGTTLDVWYPELNLGEAPAEADRRTTISVLWLTMRPTPWHSPRAGIRRQPVGRADQ